MPLTERESWQLMQALVNSVRYNVGDDGILFMEQVVAQLNTFMEPGVAWESYKLPDGHIAYRRKRVEVKNEDS